MTAIETALAGPLGPWLAIVAMGLTTFVCRSIGYLLMARVRVTPAVERGLRALPGSIVVATVLPIAVRSGPAALAGVAVSITVMSLFRSELAALLAGLAVVTAARAAGF